MNPINKFLKDQSNLNFELNESIEFSSDSAEKLNLLFKKKAKYLNLTKIRYIKPEIQRNQIWIVKNKYSDILGIEHETPHMFYVIISSETFEIEGKKLVKVQIISPFIEMATNTDEICYNPAIIGFPFIIESWNDQPILTELLNEYIGYYERIKSDSFKQGNQLNKELIESLSEDQKEFRKIEINRARYINNSVLAYLNYLEKKTSSNGKIIKMLITITSVAAIFLLFFVLSDNKINFNEYEETSMAILAKLEPEKEKLFKEDVRDINSEIIYKGFTEYETQLIKAAKSKALDKKFYEALKDLKKVHNIEKNLQLGLMLSLIYLNHGDYEKSISTLENIYEIFKNDYNNGAIIYYLGLSYALKGENNKAKSILIKLKNTNSDYESLANDLISKL